LISNVVLFYHSFSIIQQFWLNNQKY